MPFKVTIVADYWPKETSWLVENTELGDIIAEGNNKDLIPGEPVEWVECVNNRNGCYEFTINGKISIHCRSVTHLLLSTLNILYFWYDCADAFIKILEGTACVVNTEMEAIKFRMMGQN